MGAERWEEARGPEGRLNVAQDGVLSNGAGAGNLAGRARHALPTLFINRVAMVPGLSSWATFNRPYGPGAILRFDRRVPDAHCASLRSLIHSLRPPSFVYG
jgi:hypothetical protein